MRCWGHWLRGWSAAAGILLSACTMIQPDGGGTAYDRGLLAYQAGYYGLAVEELRTAINQDPTSLPALNALGAAYDQIGRYDLAQRLYQRALAVDPTSSQTLNNIGYSYLLQNRPDIAAVYLRDARRYSTAPEIAETLSANLEAAETALGTVAGETGATSVPEPPDAAPPSQIHRMTKRIQAMRTQPTVHTPPLARSDGSRIQASAAPSVTPSPPGARPTRRGTELAAVPLPAPISRPRPPDRPAPTGTSIEISNGADRLHMAERMRDHLAGLGWTVERLSPAAHHSYGRSVIYYRPGHATAAAALRQDLASAVPRLALEERDEANNADVTLRLGNDLLAFDQALFERTTAATTQVAAAAPAPSATTPRRAVAQASLPRTKRSQATAPKPRRSAALIEVANGTGRARMAARMSHHLDSHGTPVAWVTNAANFDHKTSRITFRPGKHAAATALRDILPIAIEVNENKAQRADVKLILGADLVAFDSQLAATETSATIEVSNGAGRDGMAARVKAYLDSRGQRVTHLTNADHFGYAFTTLYYKVGRRTHADQLAATLPIPVQLQQAKQMTTDLRLELGHDLLEFDARTLSVRGT